MFSDSLDEFDNSRAVAADLIAEYVAAEGKGYLQEDDDAAGDE